MVQEASVVFLTNSKCHQCTLDGAASVKVLWNLKFELSVHDDAQFCYSGICEGHVKLVMSERDNRCQSCFYSVKVTSDFIQRPDPTDYWVLTRHSYNKEYTKLVLLTAWSYFTHTNFSPNGNGRPFGYTHLSPT